MKLLPSRLTYLFENKTIRKNLRSLSKLLGVIAVIVAVYSVLFHFVMGYEGRQYSWVTGFYWALTVMSTLGLGEITFTSDLGLIFSMVVLLSGILSLLVILPFTFIQFFYAPWLEAQAQSRTPRELPDVTEDHIIITNYEPIAASLIRKLDQHGLDYVVAVQDSRAALELLDMNVKTAIGELDEPETYTKLRAERAAMILVTNDDMFSTNIIATIREVAESIPVVTVADTANSMDILEFAGATHVFQPATMLGTAMAQHTLGVSARANIVGTLGGISIAQAYAAHTPYAGKELLQSGLREKTGVILVGIWQRGEFVIPRPDTVIRSDAILLLAGSEEHFRRYDESVDGSRTYDAPVVILGGGRVGQAAADMLGESGIDYRVVEKSERSMRDDRNFILGNAADIHALEQAGISAGSPAVLITTHDDDTNIYLTIYCRKLRPDMEIISRATRDRNVSKLYSVGADIVMSYASTGVNRILNILKPDEILVLAEGLHLFKARVPASLADKTLAENQIRKRTGCNVIAVQSGDSSRVNPDPSAKLKIDEELILIGSAEAEREFERLVS